ncbi:MAG: M1 family aminopeptidase [Steroidobacteraceae bacterium]
MEARRRLAAGITLLLCMSWCGARAAEPGASSGRLPGTVAPVAYRLDLTVIPEQERFTGHVEIDIVASAPVNSILLHGRDLDITAAAVVVNGSRTSASWQQLDMLGLARLDLAAPLPPGAATLTFEYSAAFGDDALGLYRVKVGEEWYVWSQLQSIEARAVFPSFDEPGYKTPWTVTLTTRPGLLALSNAPATGSPLPAGELVTHRFAPTLPLPTYLLAFAVGPFVAVQAEAPPTPLRNRPLPLRIVATRNHAGRLDYALRETPRIIELLEQYFDQPFPFPKLDQIASPVMPGAMENAGADIYGDNILLLGPDASTPQRQTFGMVVAHELSHQWFGDLVTPAWWDDIWLNESFANWLGYRVANEWRPELNIGVNAIQEAMTAMHTDALQVGRPMRQPIVADAEIDSAFDAVTYGKGGQIIAMIASYLGDARFREGVRLHMRHRLYGTATSDDFFAALAAAANDSRVLEALRSFVTQQGIPVVDLSGEGPQYRATQFRYAVAPSTPGPQQWIIPFCARRGGETTCVMLDAPSQLVSLPGSGALVPNAGGTGYYRYFLSEPAWDALISTAALLPAGEALAAIDSLWGQFLAGRAPADQLLRAAAAFAMHPDSNVAMLLGRRLNTWQDRGILSARSVTSFRRLMSGIYGSRLASLGLDPALGAHAGDAPDQQKLRQDLAELVVAATPDTGMRTRLQAAAAGWLGGHSAALDPAFFVSAFKAQVREGGLPASQALYQRLLAAEDELFRDAALQALGDSGQPATARWLLDRLAEPQLRPTDRLALMSGLMKEVATRESAFSWLQAHHERFFRDVGMFSVEAIPALLSGYCSMARAAEVERLLASALRTTGRGELALQRALETIRNCAALKRSRGTEIATALRQAAQLPAR